MRNNNFVRRLGTGRKGHRKIWLRKNNTFHRNIACEAHQGLYIIYFFTPSNLQEVLRATHNPMKQCNNMLRQAVLPFLAYNRGNRIPSLLHSRTLSGPEINESIQRIIIFCFFFLSFFLPSIFLFFFFIQRKCETQGMCLCLCMCTCVSVYLCDRVLYSILYLYTHEYVPSSRSPSNSCDASAH